jgi:hypothetical protein
MEGRIGLTRHYSQNTMVKYAPRVTIVQKGHTLQRHAPSVLTTLIMVQQKSLNAYSVLLILSTALRAKLDADLAAPMQVQAKVHPLVAALVRSDRSRRLTNLVVA